MRIFYFAVAWIALSVWTAGANYAAMDARYGEWLCTHEEHRQRLGLSLLIGMLPPSWVAEPFLTGFYQYGWRVTPSRGFCGNGGRKEYF